MLKIGSEEFKDTVQDIKNKIKDNVLNKVYTEHKQGEQLLDIDLEELDAAIENELAGRMIDEFERVLRDETESE